MKQILSILFCILLNISLLHAETTEEKELRVKKAIEKVKAEKNIKNETPKHGYGVIQEFKNETKKGYDPKSINTKMDPKKLSEQQKSAKYLQCLREKHSNKFNSRKLCDHFKPSSMK